MGIGADLKLAREASKLSLDAISQKTKISLHYLEAIEAEDWTIFPSQAFARGFLRAFAKMVKMDPAEATIRFNEEVNPGKPVAIEPMRSAEIPETNFNLGRRKKKSVPSALAPPAQELSLEFDEGEEVDEQRAVARVLFTRNRPRPSVVNWGPAIIKIGGALLVAVLLGWGVRGCLKQRAEQKAAAVEEAENLDGTLEPALPTKVATRKPATSPLGPPKPTVTVVRPAIAPPARPALPPSSRPAAAPAVKTPTPRPAAPKPAAADPAQPSVVSGVVGAAPGASSPAPMADGFHHLVLKGVEASWIKVVIDGQTAWSILLEPGVVKEYKASQGFQVRVGNAAGVDGTINGQALGNLGPHGKVVVLTLPAGYRPVTP